MIRRYFGGSGGFQKVPDNGRICERPRREAAKYRIEKSELNPCDFAQLWAARDRILCHKK
jgi:hypothetical protein